MATVFRCTNDQRRVAIEATVDGDGNPLTVWNGIDFLEVTAPDETELTVHFIRPLAAPLDTTNVTISGGDRIRDVRVTGAVTAGDLLNVTVDPAGDFSTYTLRLRTSVLDPAPPAGIDPLLAEVPFSFKVDCATDFDCRTEPDCPPEVPPPVTIDYLAKDYASFRRLMLDRVTTLVPGWTERSPADVGVALVEVLAYAADYLSYQQDALATEAYLGTARRRISVRRHARLVDYFMHDGCNARAWVQVQVHADGVALPAGTQLLTALPGLDLAILRPSSTYDQALRLAPTIFETMHDAVLYGAHNTLGFYTWGATECCLPAGATAATLRGHFPNLHPGDVLILQEVRDPSTGLREDADPAHRYPVRLTAVTAGSDPLGGRFTTPISDSAVDVTEIAWADDDALPEPLCISAVADAAHGGRPVPEVSVAVGNLVLADHGATLRGEAVPLVPPRFRAQLLGAPVTQAAPNPYLAGAGHLPASARAALVWDVADALPAAGLDADPAAPVPTWAPQRDLLASDRTATEFVVEVDDAGVANLRFGDGVEHGALPPAGTLYATYRVGNGAAGNVGAGALHHVASDDGALLAQIDAIGNPLPASGGVDPEGIEQVRQAAPVAFRTQRRAVTPADYAVAAQGDPEVQRAAATFRWTGSWRTVFISIDRVGGLPVDAAFEDRIRARLEAYRMAGYDVEVEGPIYVPLEIAMCVAVASGYRRADVRAALLAVFSDRLLPGGGRGVFHPDNFTFGQPVYLSPLYAAAQAVDGVAGVSISTFRRWNNPLSDATASGKLALGRLEIARLANDPDFPDRGVFALTLEGGL